MRTDSLKRLAVLGLSSEQMSVVLDVLAVELAPMEAFRAGAAERTRRYHSYGAARITPSLRSEIYARDGHVCVYCGSEQDLTVTPVSKGGQTTLENLVTACRPCNSRKKDRERKRDARSGDNARTTDGQRTDVEPSRVEDKPLPFLTTEKKEESKSPPISPPPSEPDDVSRDHFNALASKLSEGFDRFWTVYPRRAGGRDKSGAFKGFRAAAQRADIEIIIAGAEAYAGYIERNGKSGTEFILQARTWLNRNSWTEDYTDARQPRSGKTTRADAFAILDAVTDEAIRREGRWPDSDEADIVELSRLRESAA